MTVREVLKILKLPNHKGDIPIGTLNSIWKQAGLK